MPLIELKKLHTDPRNANVCPPDMLETLQRHIQRSGVCPTLQVRPHPKRSGNYVIIDGHHRKQVLETLGWKEVECQILDIDETQAGLLLLTLNRLRGTDIPRKRAELIDSLLPVLGLEELTALLPEEKGEIEGLLALLRQDETALEQAFKAQLEKEREALPVPLGFMIPVADLPLVQEALEYYQAQNQRDQGQALVAICRDVLALHEVNSEHAASKT